jgi:carboxylesterase
MGHGDPSAFLFEGSDVGVLLIHGFTGSPAEMRPIGRYLNERGLTVLAPLLPGHGTQVEDLNQVQWTDWTAAAEEALAELQQSCQQTFVAGLSMGGLLTLYLASRHPELPGIVTYAAALDITDWRRHFAPIVKRLFKTVSKPEEHWADPEAEQLLWSYDVYPVGGATQVFALRDEVKASLAQITCPALITYSTSDPTVTVEAAQTILASIASEDKDALNLVECGHVMTLDAGWQTLADRTYHFITARAPELAAAGGE